MPRRLVSHECDRPLARFDLVRRRRRPRSTTACRRRVRRPAARRNVVAVPGSSSCVSGPRRFGSRVRRARRSTSDRMARPGMGLLHGVRERLRVRCAPVAPSRTSTLATRNPVGTFRQSVSDRFVAVRRCRRRPEQDPAGEHGDSKRHSRPGHDRPPTPSRPCLDELLTLQPADQSVDVLVPRRIPERDRLTLGERSQRLGQVLGAGSSAWSTSTGTTRTSAASAAPTSAARSRRVRPAAACRPARHREPIRSDHDEGGVALCDRLVDPLGEIGARLDRRHVLEHVSCPEAGDEHSNRRPARPAVSSRR